MKYSSWPGGHYPTYINPTDAEIVELVESNPDTLRICEDDENVALASGFGNTHFDIRDAYCKVQNLEYWYPKTYIVYKKGHTWLWNGFAGYDGSRLRNTSPRIKVNATTRRIISEFIRLSDQSK